MLVVCVPAILNCSVKPIAKSTRCFLKQSLLAETQGFAGGDDDMVVDGDVEGAGGSDNLVGHVDVGP